MKKDLFLKKGKIGKFLIFVSLMFLAFNIVSYTEAAQTDFVIEDDGCLVRYIGDDENVVIPKSVTSIGEGAFSHCNLTSITIPKSVTSISDHAFYYCENLTSITIPKSVTSIGDYAFYYCENLTSIIIPKSVTSIGDCAFYNCWNLTSITIPKSVTSIGDSAFSSCINLTSITISDSVTSIGDYAFSGCRNLTSITIPKSVASIGNWAFLHCENLTSITIPKSVTLISDSAFAWCSDLTIYCIENSYAHKYAIEENIQHILIEPENEEDKNVITGTYIGQLQTISTSPFCTITIDDTTYDVTDDFNQKNIIDLWLKAEEKSCQVIYNLVNGKIDKIDLFEDCVKIKVEELILDNDSISYDNDKFSSDKVKLSLDLSYTITGGYSLSDESNTT